MEVLKDRLWDGLCNSTTDQALQGCCQLSRLERWVIGKQPLPGCLRWNSKIRKLLHYFVRTASADIEFLEAMASLSISIHIQINDFSLMTNDCQNLSHFQRCSCKGVLKMQIFSCLGLIVQKKVRKDAKGSQSWHIF